MKYKEKNYGDLEGYTKLEYDEPSWPKAILIGISIVGFVAAGLWLVSFINYVPSY